MFVLGTLMLSCGGGGSSTTSTGGPVAGYNLEAIVIASGAAPTQTPTPTPTKGHHSPTPTPTPAPQATTTAVELKGEAFFHAVGTFVKHKKAHQTDITNWPGTLWTSSDQSVLAPPPPGNGGIYNAIAVGCACVDVSAGGVVAPPVGVIVYSASTATPSCALCPTPVPAATPAAASVAEKSVPSAGPSGTNAAPVAEWAFDAQMPITGALKPAPDGWLYFVTADGMLHALGADGRERWRRVVGATAPAVSDNGTVFALGPGPDLYALSPNGRPLWSMQSSSARGPLAASGGTVFIQAGGELSAAVAPGRIQWQVPVSEELDQAAVTPDGGVVAGVGGGGVVAIAPDGTVRWRFTPEGGLAGAIAVAGNRVYLGSASGTMYALDAELGSEVWELDTTEAVRGGPVADGSGLVFFASDALYAVRSDGTVAWSKQLAPQDLRAPLAAGRLGGLFAPAPNRAAVLVKADGSVRWTTRSFGQVEQATVSSSGTLFVATADGHIYALR
jgi:eukaryotic-like serine/threonine-protein kinase